MSTVLDARRIERFGLMPIRNEDRLEEWPRGAKRTDFVTRREALNLLGLSPKSRGSLIKLVERGELREFVPLNANGVLLLRAEVLRLGKGGVLVG